MNNLLSYALQATILLAVLYASYKTFLARDSFHTAKRMVLLLGIACSLTIPALPITIYVTPEAAMASAHQPLATTEAQPTQFASQSQPTTTMAPPAANAEFDWLVLIFAIYIAGIICLLTYRLIGIARVLSLLRRSPETTPFRGVKVLTSPGKIAPFCFGRKIIIPQSEASEDLDIVLDHEYAHIEHRHNVDLLIINILTTVMWFNPFIWLLRRELILLQEYQADKQVINRGIEPKKYQYLLITRVASVNNLQPIVNQFGSSQLLKRITMMKKQSKSISKLKLVAFIPLLAIAMLACAQTLPTPTSSPKSNAFTLPYSGRIMGTFGTQNNPSDNTTSFHNGIDIVVDNDTVRSPFSGEVTLCEFDKNGDGNKLIIAHQGGIETTYAHLAKFLVSKGATVKNGEPIAIVGNTGRSTGKHLHLECRIDGQIVDPASVMPINTENQSYTLPQLKALLNSRPNAIIETYFSNGSFFSSTESPLTPMAADYIDFSKVYSWEVVSGEQLRKIYPDANVDYLIKFIIQTTGNKPEINLDNVNMVYKVYDYNGTLIKEAFGTQTKIIEAISTSDIASVSYNARNVTSTIVLKQPTGK